jgi:hypothetical protein
MSSGKLSSMHQFVMALVGVCEHIMLGIASGLESNPLNCNRASFYQLEHPS